MLRRRFPRAEPRSETLLPGNPMEQQSLRGYGSGSGLESDFMGANHLCTVKEVGTSQRA